MIFSLLFAVLSSFSAFAETEGQAPCIECSTAEKKPELLMLNWAAASSSQIVNAACVRNRPFSEKEMREYLEVSDVDPANRTSETANGVKFIDESQALVKLFKQLHEKDYFRKEEVQVKSSCSKVLCAMNEIYGKPVGTQLLFMLKKYNFNGSRLRYSKEESDNYSPWTSRELDQVLLGLESLPPQIYPIFERDRRLLHFKRGYTRTIYKGRNTMANAMIEVFDLWSEQPADEMRMTIVHELGHVIAGEKDLDESPEWLQASGWIIKPGSKSNDKTNGNEYRLNSHELPSEYAKTNPAEDLAESVVAYRYNSKNFKRKSPSRYKFIKEKIFNGVEFGSSAQCSSGYEKEKALLAERKRQRTLLDAKQKELKEKSGQLMKEFLSLPPTSIALSDTQNEMIMKICLNSYLNDAASSKREGSNACINREIKKIIYTSYLAKKGIKDVKSYMPNELMKKFDIAPGGAAQVRNYMVPRLSEAFNKALENSYMLSSTANDKECDDRVIFYHSEIPEDLKPFIKKSNGFSGSQDVEKIVAKACKMGLKDFGNSVLPRSINPFAKNHFESIFN